MGLVRPLLQECLLGYGHPIRTRWRFLQAKSAVLEERRVFLSFRRGLIWSLGLCWISKLLGCYAKVVVETTFRIIYPDSYAQFKESGRTVDELMNILTAVNLAYLPSREGGWSTRKEWRDVLSGGEKQRVSRCCILIFAVLTKSTTPIDGNGPRILSPTEVCCARRYARALT